MRVAITTENNAQYVLDTDKRELQMRGAQAQSARVFRLVDLIDAGVGKPLVVDIIEDGRPLRFQTSPITTYQRLGSRGSITPSAPTDAPPATEVHECIPVLVLRPTDDREGQGELHLRRTGKRGKLFGKLVGEGLPASEFPLTDGKVARVRSGVGYITVYAPLPNARTAELYLSRA